MSRMEPSESDFNSSFQSFMQKCLQRKSPWDEQDDSTYQGDAPVTNSSVTEINSNFIPSPPSSDKAPNLRKSIMSRRSVRVHRNPSMLDLQYLPTPPSGEKEPEYQNVPTSSCGRTDIRPPTSKGVSKQKTKARKASPETSTVTDRHADFARHEDEGMVRCDVSQIRTDIPRHEGVKTATATAKSDASQIRQSVGRRDLNHVRPSVARSDVSQTHTGEHKPHVPHPPRRGNRRDDQPSHRRESVKARNNSPTRGPNVEQRKYYIPSPPPCGPRPNSRDYIYSAPRDNKENWFYDPPVPSPPPPPDSFADIPDIDKKVLELGNLVPKTYCLRAQLRTPPMGVGRKYQLPPPSSRIPFINGNFPSVPPPTIKRALGGQLADHEYAGQEAAKLNSADLLDITATKRMHPFDEIVKENSAQPPLSMLDTYVHLNLPERTSPCKIEVVEPEFPEGDWTGATQGYNFMIKCNQHELLQKRQLEGEIDISKFFELLAQATAEQPEQSPEIETETKPKKSKKKKGNKKTKTKKSKNQPSNHETPTKHPSIEQQ